MSKRNKNRNADEVAETTDVEAAQATEAPESEVQATERTKRGTSLAAQIKSHFMEIVGEFVSSGQVAGQTLTNAVEVFEQIPVTAAVGIPYEVQIKNIDDAVTKMFASKNIDQDELRRLLNRKQRLEKLIAGDETSDATDEAAASQTA